MEHYIKFNFSVLDYLDPEKNRYRYMLEGFDSDWIDSSTHGSATYTNLPAGDYVLRVQGANSSGVWNLEGISLPVRILPPPWKTWWAFTCYAILTFFSVWVLIRIYDRWRIARMAAEQNVQMQYALERADDEIQELTELHEDLVRSVHSHNLSTLGLIKGFLADGSERSAGSQPDGHVESHVKRVRALELLQGCVFYQNDALMADLHRYTDMVITELLPVFPFDTATLSTINDVDESLVPATVASPIAVIIFELLENSFQHGFENGMPAKYVEIILKVSADHARDTTAFRLSVQDNGVGIPHNIDLVAPETAGLSVVKMMAQKLSASVLVSRDHGTAVAIEFTLPGTPF